MQNPFSSSRKWSMPQAIAKNRDIIEQRKIADNEATTSQLVKLLNTKGYNNAITEDSRVDCSRYCIITCTYCIERTCISNSLPILDTDRYMANSLRVNGKFTYFYLQLLFNAPYHTLDHPPSFLFTVSTHTHTHTHTHTLHMSRLQSCGRRVVNTRSAPGAPSSPETT